MSEAARYKFDFHFFDRQTGEISHTVTLRTKPVTPSRAKELLEKEFDKHDNGYVYAIYRGDTMLGFKDLK